MFIRWIKGVVTNMAMTLRDVYGRRRKRKRKKPKIDTRSRRRRSMSLAAPGSGKYYTGSGSDWRTKRGLKKRDRDKGGWVKPKWTKPQWGVKIKDRV